MKVCTKCKKEKENKMFYHAKKVKGGLSSWCKDCIREYQKEHYHKWASRQKGYPYGS